jgi:CHRD domain
MNTTKLMLAVAAATLVSATVYVALGNAATAKHVPADRALSGVPMAMSPDQLPNQFRTQLRGDVKSSKGTAILKRKGNDVEYSFNWDGMTSSVISGHFHTAPQGQVGVRGYSICGVAGESPACPKGKRGSISGVWKNADIAAFERGEVTIAFHTEVYPAPIGEIAVYIPAKK